MAKTLSSISGGTRPYSGTRIIDLAGRLGAYATRLFADLGAEVIRIEPPGGRADRNEGEAIPTATGEAMSASFAFLNVNKKSVTIDLATDAGLHLLAAIVRGAQAVVYEADGQREKILPLLAAIPGARVTTVISDFGLTGPYANFIGCDLVDQALGGIAWLSGRSGEPPLRLAGDQSGIVASIYAAVATAAALWDVETRGARHLLDVSAQEAIAHSLQNTIQMYDIAGIVTQRGGVRRDVMEGIFACRDGFVFLAAPPFMDDQWNQIIAWMMEEGFAEHARLREEQWSSRELRASSDLRQEFKTIFERFLANKPRADIADQCIARKILIAPVSTVADLPDDPQLVHRQFFASLHIPEVGRIVPFPGAPFRLSEPVWQLNAAAPRAGASNPEIVPAATAQLRRVGAADVP
jgi:benzylsuccinate CoA-transferase BbsE subunit